MSRTSLLQPHLDIHPGARRYKNLSIARFKPQTPNPYLFLPTTIYTPPFPLPSSTYPLKLSRLHQSPPPQPPYSAEFHIMALHLAQLGALLKQSPAPLMRSRNGVGHIKRRVSEHGSDQIHRGSTSSLSPRISTVHQSDIVSADRSEAVVENNDPINWNGSPKGPQINPAVHPGGLIQMNDNSTINNGPQSDVVRQLLVAAALAGGTVGLSIGVTGTVLTLRR
ncbi:hypothetical protein BDQ17DRAFT_1435185 [Cyathus striatus]|nr:hypothetical protein BDQ17DRAFT_1435185 [Cyathus striatus]